VRAVSVLALFPHEAASPIPVQILPDHFRPNILLGKMLNIASLCCFPRFWHYYDMARDPVRSSRGIPTNPISFPPTQVYSNTKGANYS
jgi:hypothetical protein